MEAALENLKTETVKQVKVLSQKNKETESTKRQNDVKELLDKQDKNDINVASDERKADLNQLTEDLTAKKKKLDTATQKSDDFKKELELINAKIKQYTDERKLVPGDRKL